MYTLEGTVLTQTSCTFVRMFISIKSRSQLKLGHIRSKARSQGQILEKKTCVHSGRYSLDLILIIYVKIVLAKRTDLKVGHVGSDFYCIVLLFYVHGKHLRSCRDGQLT